MKPPTRGEAVAFKLTTKTDTDNVQVPAIILSTPQPIENPSNVNAPLSSVSAPRQPSPHLGAKPAGLAGPGGSMPNFAAQVFSGS